MKVLSVLALFFVVLSAHAEDPRTIDEAWQYVSQPDQSNRWIVISHEDGRYVQCENARDFVRCPFPVWAKVVPGSGDVALVDYSDQPLPEVEGSILKKYAVYRDIKALIAFAKGKDLEYGGVYAHLQNRAGDIVGTEWDFVIVFDLDDPTAVSTLQQVFLDAYGMTSLDQLSVETDSSS